MTAFHPTGARRLALIEWPQWGHEEQFLDAKAERPLEISKRTVGEYSVGGMSVLVACDLNLHHLCHSFY